ncbi:MAG: fructosamine kinase family protein, partial [Bacteroidota bacterium]|nr:fructosamine kinase family protein [Bacteroidota bacterium]
MAFHKEQDIINLCIEKLAIIYDQSVRLNNSCSVGGGCINHSVKVSTSVGDFFLKWNADCPSDLFLKEAAGLEEIHSVENQYLLIPKVIWSKEADEWPGLLLLEYFQPAATTSGFDERLGRGVARLHSKTASNYGFHHSNYCGTTIQDDTWTNNWAEFYAQHRIWNLV